MREVLAGQAAGQAVDYGRGGNNATQPAQSPMDQALFRQSNAITRLQEAVEHLSAQLRPVLGPIPEEKPPGNPTGTLQPASIRVADQIEERTRSIDIATNRLLQLLQRLEV